MSGPETESNMDIEVLIREIQKRPILWDVQFDGFKNKPMKDKAWSDLCAAVFDKYDDKSDAEKKLLAQEVMLKWKSTRDNYIRTVRKQETEGFRTTPMNGKFGKIRKRFYHDDQLSFLLKNRKTRSTNLVEPRLKRDVTDSFEEEDSIELVEEPYFQQIQVEGGLVPERFEHAQESKSPTDYEREFVFDNPEGAEPTAMAVYHKNRSYQEAQSEGMDHGAVKNGATALPPPLPLPLPREMGEDEHFFHSMLPAVITLSSRQKMRFRIKVMEALLEVQQAH